MSESNNPANVPAQERADGPYWVKWWKFDCGETKPSAKWTIAEWDSANEEWSHHRGSPAEIGPRIPSPDEAPTSEQAARPEEPPEPPKIVIHLQGIIADGRGDCPESKYLWWLAKEAYAHIDQLTARLAAPHPDTVPCACCVDRGGADGHCMDGCRCSSTVRK